MTVVAVDVEARAAEATAATITDAGGRCRAEVVDVSDAAAVEALAARCDGELGGTHLLCNNAGVFAGGLLWERPVADFEWTMAVNVYGIVHAIRSFVPRMLARGDEAHIVDTASMGGLVTNAYSGPYYTSKFAAVGLTECLHHDLRTVNAPIGVSVLVPSLIATNIGTSERNRPEHLVPLDLEGPSPDAEFVRQMLVASTEAGMDPAEVAQLVLTAVRAGDFYIPTKPSYDAQITSRYEDMLARRAPRSPELD
jgi:NAD(P)-dependent dehydrogenase (short-subunit alcohol dehydrogenase family)